MTNKERADRVEKRLGLRGKDTDKEYYRVADVICDLIHYCDHNKIEFEQEYNMAQTFYNSEK